MKSVKVLGIIPVRGGSKGIKDKNIKKILNKPLIEYTINAAKKSKILNDFIISTDSKKIAQIAENLGAKVPFIRPSKLSTDKALATDTIRHAVLEYEKIKKLKIETVVMLQATAPLRKSFHIDDALEKFFKSGFDSCISVVNVDNSHPFKMKRIVGNQLVDFIETGLENPPRQSLPKVYIVNGALYITKRDLIVEKKTFKGNSCLPYEMERVDSVNIDSNLDFLLAEQVMTLRKEN